MLITLKELKRFSTLCPQVKTIGYIEGNWHDDTRQNLNSIIFGLTLKSSNNFIQREINGTKTGVSCPAFRFSFPGDKIRNLSPEPWDELFFTYSTNLKGELRHISEKNHSYREISLSVTLMDCVKKLRYLMEHSHEPGNADRIDLAAYQLIGECQVADASPNVDDPIEKRIIDIASWIQQNYIERLDIAQIIRDKNIPYSTFLRKWKKMYKCAPMQYALNLKIQEACRLLSETNLSLETIAYQLRFSDPLYFSRLFRRYQGVSPRMFRQG